LEVPGLAARRKGVSGASAAGVDIAVLSLRGAGDRAGARFPSRGDGVQGVMFPGQARAARRRAGKRGPAVTGRVRGRGAKLRPGKLGLGDRVLAGDRSQPLGAMAVRRGAVDRHWQTKSGVSWGDLGPPGGGRGPLDKKSLVFFVGGQQGGPQGAAQPWGWSGWTQAPRQSRGPPEGTTVRRGGAVIEGGGTREPGPLPGRYVGPGTRSVFGSGQANRGQTISLRPRVSYFLLAGWGLAGIRLARVGGCLADFRRPG